MAKIYFKQLSELIEKLNLESERTREFEVKHFFSGAAFYVDGKICASISPVGLAFKLPEKEVDQLISSGIAKSLRYFPAGPIKRNYALFEAPNLAMVKCWRKYFMKAVQSV
jgi:hypothetical protein